LSIKVDANVRGFMQVGNVLPSSPAYWSPIELLKLKLHISTQRSKSSPVCCWDMHLTMKDAFRLAHLH